MSFCDDEYRREYEHQYEDLEEECSFCGKKHKIQILYNDFGGYRLGLDCGGRHDYLSGICTYEGALTELEAIAFYFEKFRD